MRPGTLVGRSKRTRSAVATNRKVRSQSSRSPSSSSTSAADTRRRRRRPTHYRPTKKDVNLDPKVYFNSSCARARKPLHDAAPKIFRALDTERDGGLSKRNLLVDFKRRSRVHRTHYNSEFEKKKIIKIVRSSGPMGFLTVFLVYRIGKDTCTLARCYWSCGSTEYAQYGVIQCFGLVVRTIVRGMQAVAGTGTVYWWCTSTTLVARSRVSPKMAVVVVDDSGHG